MLRSDIAAYYPSVSLDRVLGLLSEWCCDREAVHLLARFLGEWQANGLVDGLPIGPEIFGVIGTAFLKPVDDAILGVPEVKGYLRYTDDIFAFMPGPKECGGLQELLARELGALGLQISWEKTRILDDKDEALQELSEAAIDYVKNRLDQDELVGLAQLRDMLVAELTSDTPNRRRVPFALSVLTRRADRSVVSLVLASESTLELFPMQAANYFRAIQPSGDQLLERVGELLEQPPTTRHHARDLHLLRSICGERMGRIEGNLALKIAADRCRPAPVRAWGWRIAGTTQSMNLSDAADVALDPDEDFLVRRGSIVALREIQDPRRDRLLRDQRILHSRLVWPALWAAA